jgi:TrmH RNA methyltransferase
MRRDPKDRAPKRHGEATEVVQGLRAGLAAIAHRGDDVVRVAVAKGLASSAGRDVAEALRRAASRGVPISETSEAELGRLAESPQHEGLCVVTRARRWLSAHDLAESLARARGTAVALDRVRNPYNVGAILRSAAFFGVDAVLLGAPAPHPGLAPTAIRVAEGGAEHLLLSRTTDLAETLARLRARGARVVGADAHASASYRALPSGRPLVLVVGHEREGLAERVRAQCDALVAIAGAGAVESLNVAVAAGVLIAQMAATGAAPGR